MIAIVDVCSGNLRSVERAIAQAGGAVVVTRDPDVVRRADRVVVPGQGAFGVFMRGLAERGLGEALREAIASGRPYLGICLGLQVLFDESEETGEGAEGPTVRGLGVLAGRVQKLAPVDRTLKVPHMGWNQVHAPVGVPVVASVFDSIASEHVYFVHSFHAVPTDRSIVVLEADHGGPITAAIRSDNLAACQFHPEKSQGVGLALLARFVGPVTKGRAA